MSYKTSLLAVFLCAAPGPAHAQSASETLKQIYVSSATPSYYKRLIEGAVFAGDPVAARLNRASAGSAAAPIRAAAAPSAAPAAVQDARTEASFGLRQAYIFPNPSRGGQKPTLRVRVGPADSMDIRIYDARNALIHSTVLPAPQMRDDGHGQGPQYAYDYTWDTSGVGTGVYAVSIIAHKAGQADVKATRKVAVIK